MPSAPASRDELIAEWLRGNEAFKLLARKYGHAGPRPAPALDAKEAEDAHVAPFGLGPLGKSPR